MLPMATCTVEKAIRRGIRILMFNKPTQKQQPSSFPPAVLIAVACLFCGKFNNSLADCSLHHGVKNPQSAMHLQSCRSHGRHRTNFRPPKKFDRALRSHGTVQYFHSVRKELIS